MFVENDSRLDNPKIILIVLQYTHVYVFEVPSMALFTIVLNRFLFFVQKHDFP